MKHIELNERGSCPFTDRLQSIARSMLLTLLAATSLTISAQKRGDNSHYLEGAVPEVDGKVVFSKEYSIPGMPQDEIYSRAQMWLSGHLQSEENGQCLLVYENAQEGNMVGAAHNRLIFSQSALALDYAVMSYQVNINCQAERCVMAVEKVRYVYHEGQSTQEKYSAEEWITDKYALNKSKTKLVLGLAKWRRKTVDYMDDLCEDLAVALSTSAADKERALAAQAAAEEERARRRTGPIVVTQRSEVTVSDVQAPNTPPPSEQVPPAGEPENNPTVAGPVDHPQPVEEGARPEVHPAATDGYELVAPEALTGDLIQMGAGRLVLTAGGVEITANAGGSLGHMSGQAVVFSFLSPDQAYEAMESAETYTVRFFPAGQERASVVLECTKQPSQAPLEGQPRMYIGLITQAQVYRGE